MALPESISRPIIMILKILKGVKQSAPNGILNLCGDIKQYICTFSQFITA